MAFANVAGRAGFVLELDKSALDQGLPAAERQFDQATAAMATSATRAADAIGSRSGVGGMGLVGRIGLVGGAVTAAAQLGQHFENWLRVTGAEAVTASGRIRNLTAELKDFDIVGAVQAAGAAPKTFADLGVQAKDAAAALDGLQRAADTMGGTWRTIYEEAQLVAEGYREMAAAAREVLNVSLAFRDPSGRVIFGAPTGAPGPKAMPLPSFGTPIPGPTPVQEEEAALGAARRREDLQEQARIAAERVRRARYRLDIVQGGNERLYGERFGELQTALDEQDTIRDRIRQEQERRRAEARAEAERRQREAEAAREQAARDYRDRLSTREQELRNQYARAQATPGVRDDRRTASTLSTFLGREARDPRLDQGEQADFRQRQLAFLAERKRDREALAKAAMEATRDELDLQEQVLRNNVAAAELTERNKRDDLAAQRKLRDFYRRGERDDDLTPAERERFRGQRIGTQRAINELLRGKTDDGITSEQLGAVLRDFLEGQQNTLTRLFSTFVGGTGAGNALQTHALEQWTLSGNAERQRQTRILERIAAGRQQRLADEGLMA